MNDDDDSCCGLSCRASLGYDVLHMPHFQNAFYHSTCDAVNKSANLLLKHVSSYYNFIFGWWQWTAAAAAAAAVAAMTKFSFHLGFGAPPFITKCEYLIDLWIKWNSTGMICKILNWDSRMKTICSCPADNLSTTLIYLVEFKFECMPSPFQHFNIF